MAGDLGLMGRRVFIALPLHLDLSSEISEPLTTFKKRLRDVKWVKPEHSHLTLHFFASLGDGPVEVLKLILEKEAHDTDAFSLGLKDWGCFPNPRKPSVIWLGLHGEMDKLRRFHEILTRSLKSEGYPVEERVFHPHLTLGRIKRGTSLNLLGFEKEIRIPASSLKRIDQILLIESHLESQGPHYETLAEISFRQIPSA